MNKLSYIKSHELDFLHRKQVSSNVIGLDYASQLTWMLVQFLAIYSRVSYSLEKERT